MSRTRCTRHGTRCSTPPVSKPGWTSSTPIPPRAVSSLMSDSSRTATISVACGCIKPGYKAATRPATRTATPADYPPAGVDPQHFWGGCLMCRHGCAVDDYCIENFDTAREAALVNQRISAKDVGGSHVHYRRAGYDSALLDAGRERT